MTCPRTCTSSTKAIRSRTAAGSLALRLGIVLLVVGLAGVYATQDLSLSLKLIAKLGYSGYEHLKAASVGTAALGTIFVIVGLARGSGRTAAPSARRPD